MNTNMTTKKRLHARSFREFLMKKKCKELSESPSKQGNTTSVGRCDKFEGCYVRKENGDSDNFDLQQPRVNSDSRPQPDYGEATVEQYGCSVPDGFVQSPLSMDISLNEKTAVETVDDGVIGAKHVPSDNTEKMPSSAESGSDEKCKDEMEGESKFKGSPEVLRISPGFIEYWVPVGFSYLQLEKYCETLIKHSMFLCAKNKTGLIDLHDVLISARECCDHPYLVDSSLERFVNGERPVVDILTTGIEASGKLLLLDKFLHEVKGNGHRAVIVFQSNHPKSRAVELRHLLDDIIRQRFGEESYVHIYREFDRSKKRAACDLFNDEESGRFLMLMEKCSCQSGLELSSVDFVVLFNSDWCPSNDMRCLRKMSIQSRVDPLKVLRLYSSHSVEEKVLTLAKEGSSLESNMNSFSRSVNQKLLLCGATYLFDKLNDFHGNCASIDKLNSLTEDKLLLDIFDELLMLLSCQDGRECSFSFISKVLKGNGEYSAGISLHGEQDAPNIGGDIPPWAVWNSVLDGRNPKWRLLPESSEKIRRRGEYSARSIHYAECGNENELTTYKETSPSRDELVCQKSECKKAPRSAPGRKAGKLAGHPTSAGVGKELLPCGDSCNGTLVEKTCERRMKELLLKQKKEIREFFRTKMEIRAKLEEEHQLELDLINQGCNDARAKQEELKRLDSMYEKKVDKHNRQMDIKKKELEDVHLASRLEENEVQHKLISLAKMKKNEEPISSLVTESLSDFDLGPHSAENAADAPITVSDPAVLSKNKQSEEIKQDIRDASVQHHDPELLPDCLHEDTEILSLESDGESDAVSKLREELPNTIDNNEFPHPPISTAPLSENLTEKTSQDRQPVSNILPGGHLESDGENDVMTLLTEGSLDDGSNLCTSNESQLCALPGQNHSKQASELVHGDCTVEVSGRANGEIGCGGDEELDNPATVVELQGTPQQTLAEPPAPRVTSMSPGLQQSQIGIVMNDSLPVEQADGSACLLSNEVRGNAEASAVHNPQTTEVRGSCQLDPNQFPLMNSGYRPPSLHLPMQSLVGRDRTHTSMDPLDHEYKRIQNEEEEAGRICKEKMISYKSACEKEIEEIRKKYALLQRQAEVELSQKKVSLESIRTKVQTNKLLAEAWKLKDELPQCLISTEDIMKAILELPLLQQNNMPTQRTAGTTVGPTPNQVQVVHQLSDLMSVERVRLQNSSPSPSHPLPNLMMVHQPRAPPPHLRPYVLLAAPTFMSGFTSLACRPNQMTRVNHGLVPGSSWTRPYSTHPVPTHRDGSPSNPVIL